MLAAAGEVSALTPARTHLSLHQENPNRSALFFPALWINSFHWRSNKPEYGYNSCCIDGLDPRQFDDAPIAWFSK